MRWGVVARRRIEQSPLSEDPAVPVGQRGEVQDEADGLLWVDFGPPYGVVACHSSELFL